MNIIDQIDNETMQAVGRQNPRFKAGDTLRVHVKVREGSRERVQVFEGMCIARKNDGVNSSFTVRKVSFGEGVERVFPLYSPVIDKIERVRRGEVRRAKLYYLRGRTGKAARIAEQTDHAGKLAAQDAADLAAAEAKAKQAEQDAAKAEGEDVAVPQETEQATAPTQQA